ncbi:hypothetical protein L218DRAFT_830409, partial [Marasmius fiardii PR-910]
WLTQAHHIFETLEIPQDDWENYGLQFFLILLTFPLLGFSVQITVKLENLQQSVHSRLRSSYYLFMHPFLHFKDSIPVLLSWASSRNLYYWSTDPNGHSMMTEKDCLVHGLPRYVTKFQTEMKTWSLHHDYHYMQILQEAEGFDPSTTDYAHSLGQPILKIV